MKKLLLFLLLSFNLNVSSGSITIEPISSGPVTLICATPDPETTSSKIALTSVHPNHDQEIRHNQVLEGHISCNHWSALEHAYMTVSIKTSRAISLQLIRHRSFTFQQFSQKYADTIMTIGTELPLPELRTLNRPLTQKEFDEFEKEIKDLFKKIINLYKRLVAAEVKTECARFILPEITPTVVCMTGNIRSWIHFIERCSGKDSQDEMHEIVAGCREIFRHVFPDISKFLTKYRPELGWKL